MQTYDVVVIGGGPGGTTAATLLARSGRSVLLLEKEHFPRFHIGESLLPYNSRIFEELGILHELEKAGFPRKLGAQFHLGNASKSLKLIFRNGRFTRETAAFQVERSRFDQILLQNCRASGVEVREGWTVGRFAEEQDKVSLNACCDDGQSATFRGSFLIDASGRNNCTGNQEGLRVVHRHLKKVAVFGHFENVFVDEGTAAADTLIVRLQDKWFWIIPLGAKVSVGCVMNQREFAQSGQAAPEIFDYWCQASSEMRFRMRKARAVTPIQVTTDFSYYNRRLVGRRLLRVGDAAGFIDPIFSAGVYLAMYSGRLAARAVLTSTPGNAGNPRAFRHYEKEVFRAMKYYWHIVERFYTTPFMELFMEPRPKFNLPDAIVAILAGELQGGWGLELRRRTFFLLLRLQALWPLVPRLSFEEKCAQSEPVNQDPCHPSRIPTDS